MEFDSVAEYLIAFSCTADQESSYQRISRSDTISRTNHMINLNTFELIKVLQISHNLTDFDFAL